MAGWLVGGGQAQHWGCWGQGIPAPDPRPSRLWIEGPHDQWQGTGAHGWNTGQAREHPG